MVHTLKRFLETFRGSSFPTLAETEDGSVWVVKMRGSGNGVDSLLSEFLVNRIAKAAGLPVPEACIIEMPADFPWTYGTDEFDDVVLKSSGPNLGIEWVPSTTLVEYVDYPLLPDELVSQIVTLDMTFTNWDRLPISLNLLQDAHSAHWIIDHGSCRFLFQSATNRLPHLPVGHSLSTKEALFNAALFSGMTADQLTPIIDEIPELWLELTGLSRAFILERTLSVMAGTPQSEGGWLSFP